MGTGRLSTPALVGLLRGLVYAIVSLVVAAVVSLVSSLDAADLDNWAWALPFLALAARAIEGWWDNRVADVPQVGLLGGKSVNDVGTVDNAGNPV